MYAYIYIWLYCQFNCNIILLKVITSQIIHCNPPFSKSIPNTLYFCCKLFLIQQRFFEYSVFMITQVNLSRQAISQLIQIRKASYKDAQTNEI